MHNLSQIAITWLPRPGIRSSVIRLNSEDLRDSWEIGYHTIRTLLGCRNAIEWPTVRMWAGYETALANYLNEIQTEMRLRDVLPRQPITLDLFQAVIIDGPRKLSGRVFLDETMIDISTRDLAGKDLLPEWFGWSSLHKSHREALKTGDITNVVWPWERKNG